MIKKIISTCLILMALSFVFAQSKPRVMTFENPGTRRLLRSEAGNYYYYRSLPERSMNLPVEGLSSIELRSFSTQALRRPQVIVIIGGNRTTHDLQSAGRNGAYFTYAPVNVAIPQGTQKIEVLCYDRSTYFRAFYTPAPRRPASRRANLIVSEHAGQVQMRHNGDSSSYYSFSPDQDFLFTINNNRNVDLYIRAKLVDREPATFELYRNGTLVDRYEFDMRRTTRYSIQGVTSLSIGKKLVINSGSGEYRLKTVSNNIFFARPVVKRNQ
ncbi:MAG: hypothetical protein V3576_09050 [Candidatus Cloacimonadota bacterium]